jgi:hypothetical protein
MPVPLGQVLISPWMLKLRDLDVEVARPGRESASKSKGPEIPRPSASREVSRR